MQFKIIAKSFFLDMSRFRRRKQKAHGPTLTKFIVSTNNVSEKCLIEVTARQKPVVQKQTFSLSVLLKTSKSVSGFVLKNAYACTI